MAPKGGVRKRHLEQLEADTNPPPLVEDTGVGPRGGIRRRHAQASASSGSSAAQTPAAPPLKQGGIAQRMAKAADSDAPAGPSPLLKTLKRDWGRGELSSPKVQEYAQQAMASGASGLGDLAKAGASGRTPQHIQRALTHAFGKPKGTPEFTWARIPTAMGEVLHPFFLPHLWFRALFLLNPLVWLSTVTGAANAATDFWRSLANTDFVKDHPVLKEDRWSRSVPVGFYGDAGSFSKQE